MTPKSKLKQRTILSFSILFLFMTAFATAYKFVTSQKPVASHPVFQKAFEINTLIWSRLFSETRLAPEFPPPPVGKKARLNGNLGLKSPLILETWKLKVESGNETREISLEEIKSLPSVNSTIEFKCIEGWSEIISYKGVRFSDFIKHYQVGFQNLKDPDSFYRYVALETPDREYYVSLDWQSMIHPQTLLAYEMNGQVLDMAHGAPLRLIVPVKYGIKSLKRIGKIYFSNTRPPDYWAERGYDWYSGL